MADQDDATVRGSKVQRSDFTYLPPGSEPSGWKLSVHDTAVSFDPLTSFTQVHTAAVKKPRAGQGENQPALESRPSPPGLAEEFKAKYKPSRHGLPVLLAGPGTAAQVPEGILL